MRAVIIVYQDFRENDEAKSSQHRIIHRLIRSAEKSSEGEDIVKQNYEMKQEIQILREQIKFLEQTNHLQQQQQQQQQQEEEEWSDTKIINILDRSIPIKVTVNNVKREIVYMEIDVDYIKKRKRQNRETQ